MSEPDPRIAHAEVVSGPDDLVGQTLVIVDEVTLNGELVHVPRPLAGIPQALRTLLRLAATDDLALTYRQG